MVSDIVILKELPESIKNSVQAYVSCLAVVMIKDKYLDAIGSAGFQDVKIVDEKVFPADYMISDPVGKSVVKGSRIRVEKLKEVADDILSLKVSAIKPQEPHRFTKKRFWHKFVDMR